MSTVLWKPTLEEITDHANRIVGVGGPGDPRIPKDLRGMIYAMRPDDLEDLLIQCLATITATSPSQWLSYGSPGLLAALAMMLTVTRDTRVRD